MPCQSQDGMSPSDRAELIQALFRVAMYGDRGNQASMRKQIADALTAASAAPALEERATDGVAVGAPAEWATKDMSILIYHLRHDTHFDADLIEQMLAFAQRAAGKTSDGVPACEQSGGDTEVIVVPPPELNELLERADRLARALRGSRVNYAVEQQAANAIWELCDALRPRGVSGTRDQTFSRQTPMDESKTK